MKISRLLAVLLFGLIGSACAAAAAETFQDCPVCPAMAKVPAGSFMMGTPQSERVWNDNERPAHRVTIAKPFAVGVFAVTFDEWDACVADGGCKGDQPYDGGWGRGRRPVIGVSWDAAQLYVAWLSRKTGKSYRLLTEAEWEYAARDGTKTTYYWGNEFRKGNANCSDCSSQWDGRQTAPVGSFKPNAFGLYDMFGNVFQWVQDCSHDDYDGAPKDGSAWVSGDCGFRVLRGGSWKADSSNLRAASREEQIADDQSSSWGFRVARPLP